MSNFTEIIQFGDIELVKKEILKDPQNINLQGPNKLTPLMIAAENGHTEIVKLLLNHGAKTNLYDLSFGLKYEGGRWTQGYVRGESALLKATRKGHFRIVCMLLNNSEYCEERDNREYQYALKEACKNGHLSVFQLLWDFNRSHNTGNLLSLASIHGHVEIVEFLLKNNYDVDGCEEDGITALLNVCSGHSQKVELSKSIRIISILLNHGADINKQDEDGNTPLMNASVRGSLAIVITLVKNKADLDKQEKGGLTALMYAIDSDCMDVAYFLTRCGANINMQCKYGLSALILALSAGNTEIIKLLLSYGADIYQKTNDGYTSLMGAAEYGHEDIVVFLSEHKTIIDLIDDKNESAFSYAMNAGHWNIANILSKVTNKNVIMQSNLVNAFIKAAGYNQMTIIKTLLIKGIDVNCKDAYGDTALMTAAYCGYLDLVKLLLDNGANLDLKNNDMWTALMKASCGKRVEIVDFLLENGASVNEKDMSEQTALMLADNDFEIISILWVHGAEVKGVSSEIKSVFDLYEKKMRMKFIKILTGIRNVHNKISTE